MQGSYIRALHELEDVTRKRLAVPSLIGLDDRFHALLQDAPSVKVVAATFNTEPKVIVNDLMEFAKVVGF